MFKGVNKIVSDGGIVRGGIVVGSMHNLGLKIHRQKGCIRISNRPWRTANMKRQSHTYGLHGYGISGDDRITWPVDRK